MNSEVRVHQTSTIHRYWSDLVTNSLKKQIFHKNKSLGRDGQIKKGREDVGAHEGGDTLTAFVRKSSRESGGISMSIFLARDKVQSSQRVWLLSFDVQDRISCSDRTVNFRWQITTYIGGWQNKDGNAMPAIQSSAVIGKNEDGSDITQDVWG
jgi:hypothetical protein